MRIEELRLTGFGRFCNKKIVLDPKTNLIFGENEAGKTTIQHFIEGMLYGFFVPGAKRKTYTAEYAHYQPWNSTVPYEGTMICSRDGRRFRIERVFQKENESVSIYDADTGEDISTQFPYDPVTRLRVPGQALLGISKTIFCNTASISQLEAAPSEDFAAAWEDQVLSLAETADSSLSLQNVLDRLDKRAEEIGSPKRKKSPYGQSAEKLELLKREEVQAEDSGRSCDVLRKHRRELTEAQSSVEKEMSAISGRLEQCSQRQVVEQYEKARKLTEEIEKLRAEINEVTVPAEMDQLLQELGACQQAGQMLSQEEKDFAQWDDRLADLNRRFSSQPIHVQNMELLDKCLMLEERAGSIQSHNQTSQEFQQKLISKQAELDALPAADAAAIGEALVQYDAWQEEAEGEISVLKWTLLVSGGMLAIGGSALGFFASLYWFAAAALGCVLAVISLFVGNHNEKEEEALENQQKILDTFQQKDRDGLEALFHQAEEYTARRNKLTDELRELSSQPQPVFWNQNDAAEELRSYAVTVTGNPFAQWDEELVAQVKNARQLCREFMDMSHQRNGQLTQLQNHRREYAAMKNALEEKAQKLGLSTEQAQEWRSYHKAQQEQMQKKMTLEMLEKQLQEQLQDHTLESLAQEAQKVSDQTEPQEDPAALQEQLAVLDQKYKAILQESAQIDGQLATVEQMQRPLGEIREEKMAVAEQCASYQGMLDAIQLAKVKLNEASGTVQKDLTPALSKSMSDIISWLTGGRYSKVLLSRDLHIRLEDPQTGHLVSVNALSRGTMDLIYLAMRMELVNVLASDTDLPLILDDSFTQLDDRRVNSLLIYLTQHAQGQILLFTCHHREEQILRGNQIPASIIKLED